MDSDVERRLRETLGRHAGAAPRGGDMLAAVRRESGRRRQRRRVGLAAALVAGVLGVSLGVSGAGRTRAPEVAVPQAAPVSLVTGGPVAPSFPLTPHRALLGPANPAVTLDGGRATLTYVVGVGTASVQSASVRTSSAPPDTALTDRALVRLRGHDGTTGITADRDLAARVLLWPERPDLWVEIQVPDSVSLDDMVRYAAALTPEPLSQPGPFEFDLVPQGFAVDNIQPSVVTFCPPGTVPGATFDGKLAVLFDADPTTPEGRRLTVGGRPAWLATSDGYTMLHVDLGTGTRLTIQLPGTIRLAESDLVRLAAGVRVTAAARPAVG